jgi:hypothetical protein
LGCYGQGFRGTQTSSQDERDKYESYIHANTVALIAWMHLGVVSHDGLSGRLNIQRCHPT